MIKTCKMVRFIEANIAVDVDLQKGTSKSKYQLWTSDGKIIFEEPLPLQIVDGQFVRLESFNIVAYESERNKKDKKKHVFLEVWTLKGKHICTVDAKDVLG